MKQCFFQRRPVISVVHIIIGVFRFRLWIINQFCPALWASSLPLHERLKSCVLLCSLQLHPHLALSRCKALRSVKDMDHSLICTYICMASYAISRYSLEFLSRRATVSSLSIRTYLQFLHLLKLNVPFLSLFSWIFLFLSEINFQVLRKEVWAKWQFVSSVTLSKNSLLRPTHLTKSSNASYCLADQIFRSLVSLPLRFPAYAKSLHTRMFFPVLSFFYSCFSYSWNWFRDKQ
jgi:hypothetical protein